MFLTLTKLLQNRSLPMWRLPLNSLFVPLSVDTGPVTALLYLLFRLSKEVACFTTFLAFAAPFGAWAASRGYSGRLA